MMAGSLSSAEAVKAVEDSGRDLGLLQLAERSPPGVEGLVGEAGELVADELAGERSLVLDRHAGPPGVGIGGVPFREQLADPGVDLRDHRPDSAGGAG